MSDGQYLDWKFQRQDYGPDEWRARYRGLTIIIANLRPRLWTVKIDNGHRTSAHMHARSLNRAQRLGPAMADLYRGENP